MARLREQFVFPHPVNETSARVVAAGVVTMVGATLALDEPLLLAPLTYGFAARVLAGPRFSPLGLLATRVVTPRLGTDHRMVPGPPKRLAQGAGLVLSATATMLYVFKKRRLARAVLGLLGLAAGLESGFGLCLACKAFPLLVRLGLVSETSCEECSDVRWRSAASGARAA